MIWLRSFGRALATALEFGLSGVFFGGIVNGFCGAIFGLFVAFPYEFLKRSAQQNSTDTFIDTVVGLALCGAFFGGLLIGFIMSLCGFVRGWRPATPDFISVFRGVIWGAWLSLLAGGLTSVAGLYLWCMVAGDLGQFQGLFSDSIGSVLLICYCIGAFSGAFRPDLVQRFTILGKRVIHEKSGAE